VLQRYADSIDKAAALLKPAALSGSGQ